MRLSAKESPLKAYKEKPDDRRYLEETTFLHQRTNAKEMEIVLVSRSVFYR